MDNTEKLRVAMVTYLFPPTFAGGARQAIELAKALREHGVESFFIGANLKNAPSYENYEGFPLYRIKTKEKKRIDYLIYALRICKKLFIKRKSFDIVHLHSIRPFYFLIIILAKILKKPIVLSLTLIGHDDPLSLKDKSFLWRVESKVYKFYNKIICSSTALRNSCIKSGIPASKIVSIPCAIPCGNSDSQFRPVSNIEEVHQIRKELGFPLNSFLFTFVGAINSRKGCDLLFDAWKELNRDKEFLGTLILIGPYSDTLINVYEDKTFISKLKSSLSKSDKKNMIFTGNVKHAEVANYLRASDCFVFPSKQEGFGMVVIEAMASGLPVICTHIPDITIDMIENGKDGIILYKRNPIELAKMIKKIKEDKQLREYLSSNAIKKVYEKFSINRVVQQHIELYKKCCKI